MCLHSRQLAPRQGASARPSRLSGVGFRFSGSSVNGELHSDWSMALDGREVTATDTASALASARPSTSAHSLRRRVAAVGEYCACAGEEALGEQVTCPCPGDEQVACPCPGGATCVEKERKESPRPQDACVQG